ncbi:MAG: hypothetical protein QNJ19_06295 [Woeseiaceae bacterium]|nr:hypothetical protein [Woeseiaceae bacterium]
MLSRARIAAFMAAILILALVWTEASAQTMGGVYGPVVKEGHRSFEYRSAFDPDTDAFAQRVHYQHSLDSRFRWRIVAQARKTTESDVDFDFVQGEMLWDITDADKDWQTGLRFDFRLRDSGRPGRVAVTWTNQFRLQAGWTARLIGIADFEVGSGAGDDVGIQARANLYKTLSNGQRIGLELFSNYENQLDFFDLDEQRHQFGPFMTIPLKDDWHVTGGALFGLSKEAPDAVLRFFFGRRF